MEATVKLSRILDVWESFSGWYWFVTERHAGKLAFGLVRGLETEWGYFSLDDLENLRKRGLVWRVAKMNWVHCPCVVNDTVRANDERGMSSSEEVPGEAEKSGATGSGCHVHGNDQDLKGGAP